MSTNKEIMSNVRHLSSQQLQESGVRYIMLEPEHEDEIDLLDIWLVIVKRRFLLLFVLLACFLVGVLYALTVPLVYTWSTALEIGAGDYDKTGVFKSVEAPSSVLAKLQQSYIPLETKKMIDTTPGLVLVAQVNAKLDKNSNIIFLEIRGPEENRQVHIDLLNAVVAKIRLDHTRISSLKRKDMELSLSRIKNEIMRIKGHEQLLVSQSRRLDKKQVLIESRIVETRALLKLSTETRQKTVLGASTETRALFLMRIDSEIRAHRDLLARLEEQLQIKLENMRETLKMKLSENQQQQLEKKVSLERAIIQLDNLLETRAIIEPIRSLNPVGAGKKIILAVSLVAGLFLAVLVIFLAEFFEKVRNREAGNSEARTRVVENR